MKSSEGSLVPVGDGNWVEHDTLRVVEKVQEYDPSLKIQFLERVESLDQAPYRLVELCKDGQWRTVFDIWQLDDRVLDRIVAIDTMRVDVEKEIVKNNAGVKLAAERSRVDLRDHQKDLVKSIITSPKDNYTAPVDGKIVKFSSLPRMSQ